ncbi:MAG: Hpt domain-containing protein [Endozoicomonas sp.]
MTKPELLAIGITTMLNLENLESVTDNDQELIQSLLKEFISITEQDIENLVKAVSSNRSSEVTSLAHRIKGAAAVVGAEQLTDLSQQLENAGRSAQTDQFASLLESLKCSFTNVVEAIRNQ